MNVENIRKEAQRAKAVAEAYDNVLRSIDALESLEGSHAILTLDRVPSVKKKNGVSIKRSGRKKPKICSVRGCHHPVEKGYFCPNCKRTMDILKESGLKFPSVFASQIASFSHAVYSAGVDGQFDMATRLGNPKNVNVKTIKNFLTLENVISDEIRMCKICNDGPVSRRKNGTCRVCNAGFGSVYAQLKGTALDSSEFKMMLIKFRTDELRKAFGPTGAVGKIRHIHPISEFDLNGPHALENAKRFYSANNFALR